ncbi:hypothetical protein [Chromobacterium sphagni]|uniref:Cellulose biosynthesis protein BcsF n=1 Tax=Chromobacterium sphagni TaxID=1903179 RepID=A0A1S1WT89_9NEIS|nr:hypothetical protein [Chromobacterium sphagni]OHX10446.1 hypothetical protein BI347_21960 [Chromobacterium sphagni]OHX20034.1 hypothetical protein BI344_15395 [Chromobacterium sphagni]
MFNPELSQLQFMVLLAALAAGIAGYQLHARLLPWIRRLLLRRMRHFQPHPYLQRLQQQDDAPLAKSRHAEPGHKQT